MKLCRALWLLFLLLGVAACSRGVLYHQAAFVFGTQVDISVYAESSTQANAAMGAVLREFDRLHRTYHAWQPSELTAFNQQIAQGKSAEVSGEMAALLQDAKNLAAMSDELFDPAIGVWIRRWGFQSDTPGKNISVTNLSQDILASRPHMADLIIDGHTVRSRDPNVQIDFGGYLKGYALDRAASILHAGGIHNALVNVGGNIIALGKKGDQAWRVGIAHPRGNGMLASLELRDGEAVGTSGDYRRFYIKEGKRYSHIIDPRTAQPSSASQAVTILLPKGEQAGTLSDALSKPLFLVGQQWPTMAQRLGLNYVLWVGPQGQVEMSDAMHKRLETGSNPK